MGFEKKMLNDFYLPLLAPLQKIISAFYLHPGGCPSTSASNAAGFLRNPCHQLPVSFRQLCINHSADDVTLSNSSFICSPLSSSITHSLFHLFHQSLLAPTWTASSD